MPQSTWKNRNIFEDVLNRENALTDALRNFLKYPPVQDALWKTLPIPENVRARVNFSSIEAIETRPSHRRDLGEPDLVLYGADFILVIEVKIGAEPNKRHQQEAYVPWIKEEIQKSQTQRGFAVFLIPDAYPHWEKLNPCLERARGKLRRSKNSKIQVLEPIRWQQFVRELKSQNMPSLNELIREFYDHLYERFKPVIFSAEEVHLMNDKRTASGILKLQQIVEKVKDRLKSSGIQGLKKDGYDYGYASPDLYFGIWWQFWAEHGFPLCVAIPESNQSIQAFRKQYGDRVLPFEEWLVVGYNLPEPEPDTDCNTLIETIVKDIENLLVNA